MAGEMPEAEEGRRAGAREMPQRLRRTER